MLPDLHLLNTLFALICTMGLYTLVSIFRSLRETDRINDYCSSLQEDLVWLRQRMLAERLLMNGPVCVADLPAEHQKRFANIQRAYARHLHPEMELRSAFFRLLDKASGRDHSSLEAHECFSRGMLNSFFNDMTVSGGVLFTNMVGLTLLKKKGYGDRYQQIMKESGLR